MRRKFILVAFQAAALVAACGGSEVQPAASSTGGRGGANVGGANSGGTGGAGGTGGTTCDGVAPCGVQDGCCASACSPEDDDDCSGYPWFVDAEANGNATGTSWQDAWPDTTAIAWSSIQPGDRIYLSGGSGGETYSAFTVSASGSAQKRIQILRGMDPGHEGAVTLAAPLRVEGSFIAIDGGTWHGIVLIANGAAGGGGGGALWMTGDDILLRNLLFDGDYAAGGAYHTVAGSTELDTLRIEYCDFHKTAGEDHINWQGSGTLTIDHCVFTTPNPPSDGSHRDLMNPWTGPGGYNLHFTHNIVYDLASNGFAFLFQDPGQVGDIHIAYNVFASSPYVVQFGSNNSGAQSIETHNNVFFNTTAQHGGGPQATHQNDIFYGPSFTGDPVMGGSAGSNHCLWFYADDFETGQGNLDQSNPLFVDVNDPLGPDGVPFTSDDGFNLSPGSPAIDAGADSGDDSDIRNRPITGSPDIGAYEY